MLCSAQAVPSSVPSALPPEEIGHGYGCGGGIGDRHRQEGQLHMEAVEEALGRRQL